MKRVQLHDIFSSTGCNKIYVKSLAPNDNSKNQVYLAGDFDVLNIFPLKEIRADSEGPRKTKTFKSKVDFAWITNNGKIVEAPHAQFILYPDYPEVRFSGFLLGCKEAPSELMAGRLEGRLLFLGVSADRKIYGYVCSSKDELSKEVLNDKNYTTEGVFKVFSLIGDTKHVLLRELKRIYELGWIAAKRLNKFGEIIDCDAPQCGGYTLEAELGIIPNGRAEPDYQGWEMKQFSVTNFSRLDSAVITLMTPEPDGGFYVNKGVHQFLRKYGYSDKKIADRINFGGIHKEGFIHPTTNLKLELIGFNRDSGKISDPNGGIYLLDKKGTDVASWSFSSILGHWNKKHSKASYVPSKVNKDEKRHYHYGNNVMLGEETDFTLFLKQLSLGNIYYDPGIKLENASTKPKDKRRSQFRIKTKHLLSLYKRYEKINLEEVK